MLTTRIFAMTIASVVILSAPLVSAPDLSRYRQFQFGTSLAAVTELAGITSEARVLSQRPELIQETMWLPPFASGPTAQGDSARKLLFGFYNDQLFRIVVNYDREKTEGLTVADLVDAISVQYGSATLSATQTVPPQGSGTDFTDTIVAQWEDSQYSISLFRSGYLATFGLVAVSKRLDALVRTASAEAPRLDAQQAPLREISRQQRQMSDERLKQETARLVNKAAFRP
jgi:hypothetical protein